MRAITFQAIEARRQRLSACEVPSDGVLIKFKYPDGHINMRKFSLSEPIQVKCLQWVVKRHWCNTMFHIFLDLF